MNKFEQKFLTIEKTISNEKGNFNLFALMLREESQDRWDLVLSANWLDANPNKYYEYILNKIAKGLGKIEEVNKISRIIFLNKHDKFFKEIKYFIKPEQNITELKEIKINDIHFKHVLIFTSKIDNKLINNY